MSKNDPYPRVLIVLMTKIKADDPGNLLIRSQFGDWPKDRLAQVHAAGDPDGHGEFCGAYYRLQPCDRFLGGMFRLLRRGVFGMVTTDAVQGAADILPPTLPGRWMGAVKKQLGDWLIGSGLWEVVFPVRLSMPMARFVGEFKPDLVYCQGYSLGFATLPLLIARRFRIPICFQTTDDWPSYTYHGFPMGWLLRRRARQLVAGAKVRLAFGRKMQRLYEKRYGASFEATYHLDDLSRFAGGGAIGAGPVRIVYTGSIGLRRYEAVQDLVDAVGMLQDSMRPVEILIYCPGVPKDMPRALFDAPGMKFLPLPAHDALPSVLASASVLFLPESFSVAPALIEYAISSKAHLYMMSGRPVLVYGPAYSGTVGYAAEGGWAAVVARRSGDALKDALWSLLHDHTRNAALGEKARACAGRNHDLPAGRERFRRLLADAASQASQEDR